MIMHICVNMLSHNTQSPSVKQVSPNKCQQCTSPIYIKNLVHPRPTCNLNLRKGSILHCIGAEEKIMLHWPASNYFPLLLPHLSWLGLRPRLESEITPICYCLELEWEECLSWLHHKSIWQKRQVNGEITYCRLRRAKLNYCKHFSSWHIFLLPV